MFFNVNFKKKNPNNPAVIEATIIAILELFINATSSYARIVMKMDIVNQIPPNNQTPIITASKCGI